MNSIRNTILLALSAQTIAEASSRCLNDVRKAFSYPPTDVIVVEEGSCQIEMALAGFSESQIEVEVTGNKLKISGKPEETDKQRPFLHRGISRQAFERIFEFKEIVEVTEASFKNGLLTVKTREVVPESKKARKVPING